MLSPYTRQGVRRFTAQPAGSTRRILLLGAGLVFMLRLSGVVSEILPEQRVHYELHVETNVRNGSEAIVFRLPLGYDLGRIRKTVDLQGRTVFLFTDASVDPGQAKWTDLACIHAAGIQTAGHGKDSLLVLSLRPECRLKIETGSGSFRVVFEPRGVQSVSPGDYVIGPGDILSIHIRRRPILDTITKVEEDGTISLPLAGIIHASGKTSKDLARDLEEAIGRYIYHPGVVVELKGYHSHWVMVKGAVVHPGRYVLKGNETPWDILRQAGGPTSLAVDRMTVHRAVPAGSIQTTWILPLQRPKGSMSSFWLQSGDILTLSERRYIYVTGEVQHRGNLAWHPDMTLKDVIEKVGGLTLTASNTVLVFRDVGGHPRTIPVDLDHNNGESAAAFKILPNDVIKVPPGKVR